MTFAGKSYGCMEAGPPQGHAEDPATGHALAVADIRLRDLWGINPQRSLKLPCLSWR